MKSVQALPEGYALTYEIDLQKDKKMLLTVNLLAVLIAAVLLIPMLFVVPITALFDMQAGLGAYALRFGVLIVALFAYIVLHELIHGAAMKICGTKKIRYGFTGPYAFACSDDYYGKGSYLFIALAPVVLWGVVLAVINCFVPTQWFWVVYMVQLTNLSGAAGDILVTARFLRMPKEILVKDNGVSMQVFSREG